MGRIIKNIHQYRVHSLFEAAELNDKSKEGLITAFTETFIDILLDNKKNTDLGWSYSYFASRMDKDPEVNFKIILGEFEKLGWTKDALSNLFEKYGDDIANTYNDEGRGGMQDILCGSADYFLYKMTDGKVLLMGYNTKAVTADIEGDEGFIKFGYGYNKTKYGKLAMIQHFGSLDKYYDYLGQHFINFLTTKPFSYSLYSSVEFIKAVREEYDLNDESENYISTFYKYDSAKKTGTLDLAAAGINISGNIKTLLEEMLNQFGVPVDGKYEGRTVESGGSSVIEGNIVKIYFDDEHAQ